ncbi:MAG: hypothetical protein RMH75_02610 [Archaeoglobaceae archaeon]|nr:hypothetical protein [Archaeoglobaceae archaeon]
MVNRSTKIDERTYLDEFLVHPTTSNSLPKPSNTWFLLINGTSHVTVALDTTKFLVSNFNGSSYPTIEGTDKILVVGLEGTNSTNRNSYILYQFYVLIISPHDYRIVGTNSRDIDSDAFLRNIDILLAFDRRTGPNYNYDDNVILSSYSSINQIFGIDVYPAKWGAVVGHNNIEMLHKIKGKVSESLVSLTTFGLAKALPIEDWDQVISTLYTAISTALDLSPEKVPVPPAELLNVNNHTTIHISLPLTYRSEFDLLGGFKTTGLYYGFNLNFVKTGEDTIKVWTAIKIDRVHKEDLWYSYSFSIRVKVS